jgi:hypothetical protein|tara:strand:- start:1020 stop:1292 length:273 start_codon:yes stop_codon:yes gene_type:complete
MALQPGGYTDRPEDDNTKKAHPAFNRGKVRGILETLSIIKKIITGEDDGSGIINSPEIEKIRKSIFLMKNTTDKQTLQEAVKIAETLRYQ